MNVQAGERWPKTRRDALHVLWRARCHLAAHRRGDGTMFQGDRLAWLKIYNVAAELVAGKAA
ncbi:MAG: hypothetical protein LAN64_16680 [Acidobacteriia bacterium]|nr:hypothetical protein [Terriglobia bacterium]